MIWLIFISLSGIYGAIALLLKFYPKIIFEGLFLNRLCPPKRFLKLGQPEEVYGLPGAKSLGLSSSSENLIGVWHIPPPESHHESLCDARKLVVYCHGNAFHRGFDHRLQLYKNLSRSGFHVVTFDYSGYGDSSGTPTVPKLVGDAVSVLRWAVNQIKNADCTIVLWGHSLGTHISTRALLNYHFEGLRMPDCLVLEAPFTSAIEASECFPISKFVFALYPFFKSTMLSTLRHYKSVCSTIDILHSVPVPILIMHAEDDQRIDFNLGVKLYEETINNRATKSRFIRFVHVNKRHRVQHYTAKLPNLLPLFQNFIEDIKSLPSENESKYEVIKA